MRWFWVDRFTEYVAGDRAVAYKGVTLSDEFIHDHWGGYPVMPNSLIAEGMAQTSGLLVSELYKFQELVVLAKFTRLEFDGLVMPGETLKYTAQIGATKDVGAQATVTAHVGDRQQAYAEIFFARMHAESAGREDMPEKLFDKDDLCHWLHLTGVFRVGMHQDGSRMHPSDYDLPEYSSG